MEYWGAVYQGRTTGTAYWGETGGGWFMVLCSVWNNEKADMELSAYVTGRLRLWAEGVTMTGQIQDAFSEELTRIEEELQTHATILGRRGRSCNIRWGYLDFLLCKGSRGFLAVKGTGEAWVCNCNMGHATKEKLLPAKETDSLLLEFCGDVGVLLSTKAVSGEMPWQEVLAPEAIADREVLPRRLKELVVYCGEREYDLGYFLAKENRSRGTG